MRDQEPRQCAENILEAFTTRQEGQIPAESGVMGVSSGNSTEGLGIESARSDPPALGAWTGVDDWVRSSGPTLLGGRS